LALMPSLTFIARWESVDWVPLTYPDPSPSLTSAVYLACLVFFLASASSSSKSRRKDASDCAGLSRIVAFFELA
jgi:hypothetical protein